MVIVAKLDTTIINFKVRISLKEDFRIAIKSQQLHLRLNYNIRKTGGSGFFSWGGQTKPSEAKFKSAIVTLVTAALFHLAATYQY